MTEIRDRLAATTATAPLTAALPTTGDTGGLVPLPGTEPAALEHMVERLSWEATAARTLAALVEEAETRAAARGRGERGTPCSPSA